MSSRPEAEGGPLTDPSSDLRIAHSTRFRQVSNRYPRRVWEAYQGDPARAQSDSDERLAATVAAWEQEQGLPVTDWSALGRQERGETDDA